MDSKNYYRGLGVAQDAGADEIRKAYRRLALKYHPDRNPHDQQAEEKFKEINAAYQVLSQPGKRAGYDCLGSSPAAASRPANDAGGGFSDFVREAAASAPAFRTRRTAQRKSPRTKPGLEIREFVMQQLVGMRTLDSITYALCENYAVNWQQAKSLIQDVQTRQARLIRYRQAPWLVPVAVSMFIGGVGSTLFGAYIIVFVASLPVGSPAKLLALLQAPFFLAQISAMLGYAWLSVLTGIGLMMGSFRGMQQAWAALSEHFEPQQQG